MKQAFHRMHVLSYHTSPKEKGLFEERKAIDSTARSVLVIGFRREVVLFKGANSYE